jgi:hypothetical protein
LGRDREKAGDLPVRVGSLDEAGKPGKVVAQAVSTGEWRGPGDQRASVAESAVQGRAELNFAVEEVTGIRAIH